MVLFFPVLVDLALQVSLIFVFVFDFILMTGHFVDLLIFD